MESRATRPFARLGRHPIVVGFCSAALVALSLFGPASGQVTLAAGGTAPNGPGASSVWTPSNNTILGTAANTTSDVWFTGYNGIVGEVYYPTADTPNTTDLQFLVGDSAHTWVDEEKVATTSTVALYNAHSLAWTVTNTATSGKYKIHKTIYTDPARNTLIQDVTFTALTGHLSDYLLYTLYNPSMHNAGNNNTSSTQTASGKHHAGHHRLHRRLRQRAGRLDPLRQRHDQLRLRRPE